MTIEIIPLRGIPRVKRGDDIPRLIVECANASNIELKDGDILVISQKIVSKAEGRTVSLLDVEPSPFALKIAEYTGKKAEVVELILRESRSIVRMSNKHIICETNHGFVCANAGVDLSNVNGGKSATLLPVDPDRSARLIREGIFKLTGKDVAVIISDTHGRPLRRGVVNVAIGCSGIKPLKNYRGKHDLYGYTMRVTIVAVADELASAAELLMGEGDEGVPVVIIRGYNYERGDDKATVLARPAIEDLFR